MANNENNIYIIREQGEFFDAIPLSEDEEKVVKKNNTDVKDEEKK